MSRFVKVDKKLLEDIVINITNTAKNCEVRYEVGDRNFTETIASYKTMSEHYIPEKIVNSYKSNISKHLDINLEPNDTFKISNGIIDIFNSYNSRDFMFSIWSEEIIINNHGSLKPMVNKDPKALNYGVEPGVSYITVEDTTSDRKDVTIWAVKPICGMDRKYVLSPEHRNNEFTSMLYQPIDRIPVNIMVGLLETFNDNLKRDLKGIYKVTIEKIEE